MTLIGNIAKDGYGLPQLHLRQQSREVQRLFGPPQRKEAASSARVYWIYPKRGFECIVSTRTGRLLSIFFYRQGVDNFKGANLMTTLGVRPGAAADEVRQVYGEPYKSGGDFVLQNGHYVRGWISYRSGIGFQFGKDGRVDIISIFSPSRPQAHLK